MDVNGFLHDLHYDTDQAKPVDWEPDWADAPLPYKLYRGLPAFSLSADIPLTFEGDRFRPRPDLVSIGHFLWYVYGIAQVTRSVPPDDAPPEAAGPTEAHRRVVPSGGGLYPSELYVYLKFDGLPSGIYHYDAAHHRLILLREGNFDEYLGQAAGGRCEMRECFGAVFVSTVFWKNFFKYHNFSYRLQALDAGVLLGQLLETAKRFGYSAAVYYQFLDRAVNHLLGVSERMESVYAVVPLSIRGTAFDRLDPVGHTRSPAVRAADLCRELPQLFHVHRAGSRNVREYPLLLRMNEAAMMDSTASFRGMEVPGATPETNNAHVLPVVNRLTYDLAVLSRKRYSPETDFVLRRVGRQQLAGLLREAVLSSRYRSDLGSGSEEGEPLIRLYGCFYGIEGIDSGAYRYDAETHTLDRIRPGDHRAWLQYGMTLHNVNLFQVPVCLHAAGDRLHQEREWGTRGYRIQQMETGMLVQRVLLAAAASGMGGRPLLGYEAGMCDELYGLAPAGQTALIQVPVGHYRYRCRYEGSLHR